MNPARDKWFAEHGGLKGVNEAAEMATGNLGLVEAIFGAHTMDSFNQAIEAWTRTTSDAAANSPDWEGWATANVHPMADGGVGRVTGPTLFLAGERGPEDYAFSGAGRSFAGNGRDEMHVYLDGRELEAVVTRRQNRRHQLSNRVAA